MTSCLAHYKSFEFTDGLWRRTVFKRGEGPAVIVIHEIPGLHPLVVRLADRGLQQAQDQNGVWLRRGS